jgi:hypothetical protein
MNKRGLLGGLIVAGVLLVAGFFWFLGEMEEEVACAPASCCHAVTCVLESEAPNCTDRICTMDCRPGTMDCAQGHCEYIGGECEVVWDE